MNVKGQTEMEFPDPGVDRRSERAARPAPTECRDSGKHEGIQEPSLMEHVLALENLERAWKQVRANRGAPGIDGMTVEEFPAFFREHWPRIC